MDTCTLEAVHLLQTPAFLCLKNTILHLYNLLEKVFFRRLISPYLDVSAASSIIKLWKPPHFHGLKCLKRMQLCRSWRLSKKIHRLGSRERRALCSQQLLRDPASCLPPGWVSDVPAFEALGARLSCHSPWDCPGPQGWGRCTLLALTCW